MNEKIKNLIEEINDETGIVTNDGFSSVQYLTTETEFDADVKQIDAGSIDDWSGWDFSEATENLKEYVLEDNFVSYYWWKNIADSGILASDKTEKDAAILVEIAKIYLAS